jgi:hypothetical protein
MKIKLKNKETIETESVVIKKYCCDKMKCWLEKGRIVIDVHKGEVRFLTRFLQNNLEVRKQSDLSYVELPFSFEPNEEIKYCPNCGELMVDDVEREIVKKEVKGFS